MLKWFWDKDFLGQLDLAIILLILLCILFFLARRFVWWRLGALICEKYYNGGECLHSRRQGCGCGWDDPHRHRGELMSYGPLILSRSFVRKKVCEHF